MTTYTARLGRVYSHARQGLRKFGSLYPIYGFWGTLSQLWKNLFFFEKVCRLDKLLEIADKPVQCKVPLEIEVYGKGFELENWPGKREILNLRGPYGLEQFEKRLERGDLCFAAYSNREFTGFIWLELPPVSEAGYPLLKDEAFTFDGWTFENFRGKRIFSVIQQAINDYVRENRPDIRNIVTHVATWNKSSLSGDQRAGYRIVRLELTMVLFGFHRKLILKEPVPADLIMHQG
jgi:hypothetical protein